MAGKFITLEGIDGAGKSTHLAWVADVLRRRGLDVRSTREPGGTECGEKLRGLLLDRSQKLHPETEALVIFAARREHLDKVILPALAAGEWVLCDRFTDATFAYQCGGSGVARAKNEALEQWVQGSLQPDLTIYLDVAPELGRERSGRARSPDRFEREEAAFFARVREAYIQRSRALSRRIRLVDASRPILEIRESLEEVLEEILM